MHGLKTCLTLVIFSTTKLNSLPLSSRSTLSPFYWRRIPVWIEKRGPRKKKISRKKYFSAFIKIIENVKTLGNCSQNQIC